MLAAQTGIVVLCIVLAFFIQSRVTRQIGGKLDRGERSVRKTREGRVRQRDRRTVFGRARRVDDARSARCRAVSPRASTPTARPRTWNAPARLPASVSSRRSTPRRSTWSLPMSRPNIIYLNPAAQRLMSGAAADFRQVSPRFDAGHLVGSNLEVFYADGARQRDAIAALRQSATSEFVVGSRTFQTIASPIVGPDGKRIGTVVEWVDRTVEVATEKEIGNLVERGVRRQARSARVARRQAGLLRSARQRSERSRDQRR